MSGRVEAAIPDAVAPPPGNPRFPLVDGLRAIAALSIVVTHTAGLSGFNSANPLGAWTARMDCGVAIFFVLSGFLLYRPFVAARLDGRPRPRLRSYARRRALRILPAYWVALTVLALTVPAYVVGAFGPDWWKYYGLLQSWHTSTVVGGIGVAWSLSVEAAFYVVLPLYALLAARWLAGRDRDVQARAELAVLAASSVVAVTLRTIVHDARPRAPYLNTLPGMWTWFAAGLALAVLSAWLHARPVGARPRLVRAPAEHPLLCWAAALVLLTIAAKAVGLPRTFLQPYTTLNLEAEHLLYLGVAVCLVAPAVLGDGRRSAPARLLAHPVMAWLGLVSYGVFLYHQPLSADLQDLAGHVGGSFAVYTALTVAAAVGCAAISYYVVERPILRFKDRGRPRTTVPRERPAVVADPQTRSAA